VLTKIYIFRCSKKSDLLAITGDPTGDNLPPGACTGPWTLLREAEVEHGGHIAGFVSRDLFRDLDRVDRAARSPIDRVTELHAMTPAGIFAKVLAVSLCSDQAVKLAKSLANDLLDSVELRKVHWPATEGVSV
jgi:hypothetical protein